MMTIISKNNQKIKMKDGLYKFEILVPRLDWLKPPNIVLAMKRGSNGSCTIEPILHKEGTDDSIDTDEYLDASVSFSSSDWNSILLEVKLYGFRIKNSTDETVDLYVASEF